MLSTLNRSLISTARIASGKRAIVARYLSAADATATSDEADPMEIFDQIDTNGDGVLSKDEFLIAVEKMHYVSSLFGFDRIHCIWLR